MNKKIPIIAGCLIIILALIFVKMPANFASGSAAKTYSLDEIIDRAKSANIYLNLLDNKISLAQKRRDSVSGGTDLEKRKKDKELNDLIWEKDQKEKKLIIDASELYHKILINQMYVNVQNTQLERLNKEYEIKKKKMELGSETEETLLSFNVTIAECKEKLSSLKNDREELVMKLNKEIGDDLTQQLILKNANIPDERLDVKDVNELAEELAQVDYSVTKLSEDRSIAKEEKVSAAGSLLEKLEDDIIKLGYDIEDKKNEIQYKVKADYNQILNYKDEVTIKKLDQDKFSKLADVAKLRYNLGLITYLEYSKAQEDAENAICAYQDARLNYYVAVRRYKDFIKPAL